MLKIETPSLSVMFICLRRSSDHGTIEVVVVVVVVVTIFNFDFFFQDIFIKITFVGNIEVMNCTNFGIVVNSTFCKKKIAKNDYEFLSDFFCFWPF